MKGKDFDIQQSQYRIIPNKTQIQNSESAKNKQTLGKDLSKNGIQSRTKRDETSKSMAFLFAFRETQQLICRSGCVFKHRPIGLLARVWKTKIRHNIDSASVRVAAILVENEILGSKTNVQANTISTGTAQCSCFGSQYTIDRCHCTASQGITAVIGGDQIKSEN